MNTQETTNKAQDILDKAFDGKPITPKVARRKIRAAMVVQGKTYEEIGKATGSKAKYMRQSVANSVHKPATQREIRNLISYNEDDLRRIVAKAAKRMEGKLDSEKDITSTDTRVLELAMREKAMLTDKTINENSEKLPDLAKVPKEDLEAALLKHMELSQRGVQDARQSSQDAIRDTNSGKVGKDA